MGHETREAAEGAEAAMPRTLRQKDWQGARKHERSSLERGERCPASGHELAHRRGKREPATPAPSISQVKRTARVNHPPETRVDRR